jgi:LEA14-like dessication related protein
MRSFVIRCSFLLFLLVLASCALEAPQIKAVESIRLDEMTNNGAKVKIGIIVSNPNAHTIKIKGGQLDVFVNKNGIGKIDVPDTIELAKNSEEVYYLHLQSSYVQLLTALPGVIGFFNKKSAEVNIKGDIKAGAYFINKTFPVNVTQNISPDSLKLD